MSRSENGNDAAKNREVAGTDPVAQLKAEEEVLTKILHAKMARQDCLQTSDQEAVAYRISEIMVAAKELYTKDLPLVMQDHEEFAEGDMFSELAGLRMAFFHLRDLITDFDEAFMDAMTHERDGDEDDEADEDEEDEEPSSDEQEDEDESTADKE